MDEMKETTEAQAPRRYPLANDANGDPIDVPAEAVAWRVRKMAKKAGRPKVIYDPETGRQLEVPLAVEDLGEFVSEDDRYRLEAVDREGRHIAGCVGFTEVFADDEDEAEEGGAATPQLIQLVAQLVDTNSRVMQAMASAFGTVHPSQPPLMPIMPSPEPRQSNNEIGQMMLGFIQQIMTAREAKVPQNGAPQTPKAGA
jgi:hypothetical protein